MNNKIVDFVINSNSKALATTGVNGINVVPVSMINIENNKIYLYDFFMNKTVENIETDKKVSLVCWSDMTGVQIKGEVEYITEGKLFEKNVSWVKTQNPSRITKGVLIITPIEIFDISPGKYFDSEDLKN